MYYIGVDLGGTKMAAGLVGDNGKILYKSSVPTGIGKSPEQLLGDLAGLCNDIVEKSGVSYGEIISVGVGVPGTVNPELGIIEYTVNLQLKDVHVSSFLRDKIPVPVYIDNDANCAALGENTWGAAKGRKSAVMITLGTGVGGGIVLDGKIWSGAFFTAGEVGHHVIVADGTPCNCGRNGCWEKYASASALAQWGREDAQVNKNGKIYELCGGDLDCIDAKMVFDACDMNDPAAQKITDGYIRYLSMGLVNIINILQPEAIVVGGGVCARGEKLLEPVRKVVGEMLGGFGGLRTELVLAELGNDGGIIGAAMLNGNIKVM